MNTTDTLNVVNLNKEKLQEMIDILDALKSEMTDVIIKHGSIRQFNDSTTIVVDIKFPFDFPLDLNLQLVKSYIEILNVFESSMEDKDSITLKVDVHDNDGMIRRVLTISDERTQVSLVMGDEEHLANSYLSDEEFSAISSANVLTSIELDKIDIDRGIALAKSSYFGTDSLVLSIKEGNGSLLVKSDSSVRNATLKKGLKLENLSDNEYRIPLNIFTMFPIESTTIDILETTTGVGSILLVRLHTSYGNVYGRLLLAY